MSYPLMKHDIFISHKSQDGEGARLLCAALEKQGTKCWIAPRDIRPGQDWDIAIADAIDAARIVVVFFSSLADESPQVKREVQLAFESKIGVVPLRVEDVKPKKLRYYLTGVHWLEAVKPSLSEQINEVVSRLKAILQTTGSPANASGAAPLSPLDSALSNPSTKVSKPSTPQKSSTSQVEVADNSGKTTPNSDAKTQDVKRPDSNGQHDIFISYARRDKDFAEALYESLTFDGLRVWMDSSSVSAGSEWEGQISKALQTSRIMFLVVSQSSMDSWQVLDEISVALKQGLTIVPIQIETLKGHTTYPPQLKKIQWINAKDDQSKRKLDEIVKIAHSKLGADVSSLSPPSEAGAKQKTTAEASNSPTLQKIITAKGPKESRLFAAVRAGATDVEATDRLSQTVLHYAARFLELEIVRLLLDRGANVNVRDQDGLTPLHLSIGSVSLQRLLILRGADSEAKTKEGLTPLNLAYDYGMTSTIYFLELLAEVKRGDTKPNQALQKAFGLHNHKANKILSAVVAGADDVAMCDEKVRTALHWAAQENEPEIVELLLNKGANPRAVDAAGNTPAALAGKQGHSEIVKMLRAWEKNGSVSKSKTPLSREPAKAEVKSKAPPAVSPANGKLREALGSQGPYKTKNVVRAILEGATDFSLTDQMGRTALYAPRCIGPSKQAMWMP